MIEFLHDPTRAGLELGFGSACVAATSLCLFLASIRRSARQDVYNPEVLQRQMYAPDDDDEEIVIAESIVAPIGSPASVVSSRRWSPIRLAGIGVSAMVLCTSLWFTVHTARILRFTEAGDVSMAEKDYLNAEKQFTEAELLDGKVIQTHVKLAGALLNQHKVVPAIVELKLATGGNRTDAATHLLLGDSLQLIDRPAEAETAYRQAIAISPANVTAYVSLGSCLIRIGRLEDAVRELKYALVLDPGSAKAHMMLGNTLMAQSQVNSSLDELKRAVELAPQDPAVHNALAAGYARSGKFLDAANEFRGLLAIRPDFAVGYYNLGQALLELKDKAGALGAFETYVRKCSAHPNGALIGIPQAFSQIQSLRKELYSTQRVGQSPAEQTR